MSVELICPDTFSTLFDAEPVSLEVDSDIDLLIFLMNWVQVMSTDEIVKRSTFDTNSGCFIVPARTTSVFVEPRGSE